MNGFQPIECLVQGLVLLGEVEANEMVPLQVGDLVDIAGYHFQFL